MKGEEMRALLFATIAAASLLALAVSADNSQPPQPSTSGDDAKLICRQIVHQGMVARTECHTQRQWDSLREYNQRQLRETQQRGLLSNPH
jgi:Spy/CpxP family protein refolding chaperone